jgi:membrane protein implicated in regulation of membrane protease activity
MDILPGLNAFTVFLVIAAAGLLFLMISLFFGEIFEHFDTSLDHDLDHGGPSFFSPRVMSVFVTAFGGVGAIASHYRLSPLAASGMGFVSGLVMSSLVLVFARFLYRQQASSDLRSTDLVGQSARVVVTIPAGGVGQVRCRIGEELVDKIARARDGGTVPENAAVRVEEVLGETLIVSRQ